MLTPDQELQAKKEGWKVVSGYVARAYDARGQCPFRTISHVIRFLRQKGKTSDWHRDVYLNLPWTNTDNQMSYEEGWRLTFNEIVLRSTSRSPIFLFSRSAIFAPSKQPIWSPSRSWSWSGGTLISGYSAK